MSRSGWTGWAVALALAAACGAGGGAPGAKGQPPAPGRYDAVAGNEGDAHAMPPTYDSGKR